MRILHVYKDYFPVLGGIENHIKGLAECQAKADHEVTVLTTDPFGRTTTEHHNSLRVIRAGRLGEVASTPISLDLIRQLGRLEPDIVHLHFPYPLGEVAYFLRGKCRTLVLSYHSDITRKTLLIHMYRPFIRRLLNRSDRIVVSSETYLKTSEPLQPVRSKCQVVPLGIDPNRFSSPDGKEVKRIRIRYGEKLVLFVGRMRQYKGLDYLIRAMQRIEGHLLAIGDGPMKSSWEDLTRKLNLERRVTFLSEVPDELLPDYYGAADLLVQPSSNRAEAFGLVLLEAMAARLPVVSTELQTGTSFVNQHGETGLVVPPKDPEALAQAVKELLGDENLRSSMGENGCRRVHQCFGLSQMVERMDAVYQEVLS